MSIILYFYCVLHLFLSVYLFDSVSLSVNYDRPLDGETRTCCRLVSKSQISTHTRCLGPVYTHIDSALLFFFSTYNVEQEQKSIFAARNDKLFRLGINFRTFLVRVGFSRSTAGWIIESLMIKKKKIFLSILKTIYTCNILHLL